MFSYQARLFIFSLFLVVAVLSIVLVLVWTMKSFLSRQSTNMCLPNNNGVIVCDEGILLLFLEKAVEKNYAYLEHAEKRRQKSYVEDHEVRLLEIYDNNYWEMKPAAKITGKLQTITTDNENENM